MPRIASGARARTLSGLASFSPKAATGTGFFAAHVHENELTRTIEGSEPRGGTCWRPYPSASFRRRRRPSSQHAREVRTNQAVPPASPHQQARDQSSSCIARSHLHYFPPPKEAEESKWCLCRARACTRSLWDRGSCRDHCTTLAEAQLGPARFRALCVTSLLASLLLWLHMVAKQT